MADFFIKTLLTLFIAIGPVENGAFFAGLTQNHTSRQRRKLALKTTIIATAIIIIFPFIGERTLHLMDIQLYALELGGGILLFILSINMVMGDFDHDSNLSKSLENKDISFFPLAMPLVAGPATMTQSTVLFANSSGNISNQTLVIAGILIMMTLSYICFLLGDKLIHILSKRGVEMITRVLGIFLAAISLDLIIEGLRHANLFNFAQ